MVAAEQAPLAPVSVASNLTLADLGAALAAGWRDFRALPAYGLFFSACYILAGYALYYALFTRGEPGWLALAAAGFPLVAPFTAVGLYEVSRRREAGLAITWGTVFGAIRGRGDDQVAMMGFILFMAFGLWLGIAHGIVAVFLHSSAVGPATLDLFLHGKGLAMLIVGSLVGAMLALAFFSITVVSLPMLVDRRVDFMTAIIVSLGAVRSNARVMLSWAALIAVLLFMALLPAFLGLLVILPLLGHATWHLYRRAVSPSGLAMENATGPTAAAPSQCQTSP